jgi:tripartite-type tricarboxylate transporter receptor subunit TctC
MVRKVISVLAASTAALFLGSMSYAAESAYPEKPITLLIPFPVGSGSDSTARVVAQELSKEIGQAVVVENKPGANGFIATRMAAKAKPDGYTLLLTSNTHYANKFLFKNVPYDPIGDFVTVAVVRAPSPLVLAVSADSPYKTLDDLTKSAQESPGALTYGSGNSSSRVSAELYKQQIDADIVYVPYKGNADALNDVSAGRVDLIFSDVGAMRSMYEAGRIRALAITGEQKMPFLKGVKSTADLGLPGLELSSWGIFLAPKGTPEPIINKLHELISDTADTKPVKDLIAATDGIPTRMTRAEMDSFVQNELEKWGSIIQRAGIEPQ